MSDELGDEQYLQEEHKVLGVHWNIIEDRLVLNINHIAESARTFEPSKRNIVILRHIGYHHASHNSIQDASTRLM